MIEMTSPRPEEEGERSTAEARWLLGEESKPSTPPPPSAAVASAPGESYDLDGSEPEPIHSTPPEVVPPVLAPPPLPKPKSKTKSRPDDVPDESADPEDAVDPVWSRWGEWGPTLILLGVVMVTLGALDVLAISIGLYRTAFALFPIGGVILVLLSYPIWITFERPVRVTPEQAVNDFYAALSHFLPHYRRMWYLLSSEGRDSTEFSTIEGLEAYWKRRLVALGKAEDLRYNPLQFEVVDFQSLKNSRQTAAKATYTVNVFSGSGRDDAPVATIPVQMGLVKGPDRMWYLDSGTLP